jgi:hypothetical protein
MRLSQVAVPTGQNRRRKHTPPTLRKAGAASPPYAGLLAAVVIGAVNCADQAGTHELASGTVAERLT